MNRNQGIDLLRGVAVALVMLRHAFPLPFAGAGVVGVVIFFALSGHLITGVLLDELERDGRVRFGRFAARRAARLVPALVVMVAVLALVTITLDPLGDRDVVGRTVLVSLTWTADLPFDHGSDAIFHLWTLAVEEQFYLVWPAILVFAFHRGRIGVALGTVAIGSLVLCALSLRWAGAHPDLVYTFPTSWAICFVIGAASRVLRDRVQVPVSVAGAALVVVAILAVVPLRGHMATYLLAAPVIAVLTSAVTLVAWRRWPVVRFGMLRPLVALGVISYGAYLWNYPVTLWLRGIGPAAGIVAMGLTIIAAAASWWLVEKPVSRLVRRVQHQWIPEAAA